MNLANEQALLEQTTYDPDAFEPLYDYYFPRLYAYMYYQVQNRQDAQDLVAETFLNVVKGLSGFKWRHEQSFAAWIFTIARHALVNFRQRRNGDRSLLPLDAIHNWPVSDTTQPEELMLKRENLAQLGRAIGSLAPRQQEIIVLRFFAGLRNQEIAQLLTLDARSVSAYLTRGLEELQRRFEAHSDDPKNRMVWFRTTQNRTADDWQELLTDEQNEATLSDHYFRLIQSTLETNDEPCQSFRDGLLDWLQQNYPLRSYRGRLVKWWLTLWRTRKLSKK